MFFFRMMSNWHYDWSIWNLCVFPGTFQYIFVPQFRFMDKKSVLLTGATGTMGWAGLEELLKYKEVLDISVLVRPSRKNKRKMASYSQYLRIIWGDLTSFEDVEEAIRGMDYILHVGGMVSPKADRFPRETLRTNVVGAENIVRAVLAQPNADQIKVVYIGSVAQTGDRNEPLHWGRTGDPISVSTYDYYGISKVMAERVFVESGLKYWVCLRQSGILYADLLRKNFKPIMFHVPIRGCLEWATLEDSARLLANICVLELPESFWRHFYNIGSGQEYRLTNYEFECKLLGALSCPKPERIFNTKWFVTRNFHGHWYLDSDKLEEYIHFRRNVPVDEYFKSLSSQLPWYFRVAKRIPSFVFKWIVYPLIYNRKHGTQWWILFNNREKVDVYYGGISRWKKIPSWKDFDLSRPTDTPVLLEHGYDETKPESCLGLEDMVQAASFRGGRCLSESMIKGDIHKPLEWECHLGHHFHATPSLVLHGGHWCPYCLGTPWKQSVIAKGNPFFAQVWYPFHSSQEVGVYGESFPEHEWR